MSESEARVYRAQPGPQRAFCSSKADIAIYGGAAGGGKSYALLLEAAKWAQVKGYRAVLFRRIGADLEGGGGLWDESQEMYRALGGTPVGSPKLRWTFGGQRARIDFDHVQFESDKYRHQGKQYAFIGFDELTHFTETQFWYLFSRNRSRCGVTPYVRATCNPDPDSFVRKLIDWWIGDDGLPIRSRSGVLRWFVRDADELVWADSPLELKSRYPKLKPKSLTFIPASLSDNPALTNADPDYESKLLALPRVERERLLGSNWDVRPAAGSFFRRPWFRMIEPEDVHRLELLKTVRTWDFAATEPSSANPDPDWTRGMKVSRTRDDRYVINHVESARTTPGGVERLVRATAEHDGIHTTVGIWEDPGGAGVVAADRMLTVLSGFRLERVRAARDKLTYAGIWSPHVEGGRVLVVRGPWNDAFFNEAEAFPMKKVHDDQIDAGSLAFLMLMEVAQFGYDPVPTRAETRARRDREEDEEDEAWGGDFRRRGGAL